MSDKPFHITDYEQYVRCIVCKCLLGYAPYPSDEYVCVRCTSYISEIDKKLEQSFKSLEKNE